MVNDDAFGLVDVDTSRAWMVDTNKSKNIIVLGIAKSDASR